MQIPNNPMQLMQYLNGGGNPMVLLQQIAGRNPMAANMLNVLNSRSMTPKQIAENLCKSNGVNPEDIAKQLGMKLPK